MTCVPTAGSLMTGQFEGKMIIAASLWDREAMPWQADWYAARVRDHQGSKADDHLRLYYTDHALHGDERGLEDASRTVSYHGVLQQALRDLAAWVEKGTPPPPSTAYRIEDGQVKVPALAAERRGIQPVVTLQVQGAERVEIKAGESVTFTGTITVPPGTGAIEIPLCGDDGSRGPSRRGRASRRSSGLPGRPTGGRRRHLCRAAGPAHVIG